MKVGDVIWRYIKLRSITESPASARMLNLSVIIQRIPFILNLMMNGAGIRQKQRVFRGKESNHTLELQHLQEHSQLPVPLPQMTPCLRKHYIEPSPIPTRRCLQIPHITTPSSSLSCLYKIILCHLELLDQQSVRIHIRPRRIDQLTLTHK